MVELRGRGGGKIEGEGVVKMRWEGRVKIEVKLMKSREY